MSPSKRAGGTVEPGADQPTDAAPAPETGRSSPNQTPASARIGPAAARVKRRRPVGPGSPKPSRDSASTRPSSSSSITRRNAPPSRQGSGNGNGTAATHGNGDGHGAPDQPGKDPTPLPRPTVSLPRRPVEVATVPLPTIAPPARRPAPVETPTARVGGPAFPATIDVTTVPMVPASEPVGGFSTNTISSHRVAPVPRMVGRRPRVRRVTRVVRHIDPWSVFKVAAVFSVVLYAVALTSVVLLWNVAYSTGTIDNVERFFESFGWEQFEFNGGALYHSVWTGGLFVAVGLTGAIVLAATLFNLITDLVGGIRMTVLEEEVVERTTSPMRRFVVRRGGGPVEDD